MKRASVLLVMFAAGLLLLPAPAPLREHVAHVVGIVAEKEMGGVDASRSVTSMKDHHAFIERTVGEFVGDAMSPKTTSCSISVSGNDAIPFPSERTRPKHAAVFIRLSNFFFEPFSQGAGGVIIFAFSRTEPCAVVLDGAWARLKSYAAEFARSSNSWRVCARHKLHFTRSVS